MNSGFSFPNFTESELKSLNVRAELHGKDFVTAVDIGMTTVGTNQWLLMFGMGRYYGIYVPADATADEEPPQGELDGIEAVSPRPKLRYEAGEIDIPNEYKGVNVVFDYGAGGKSNIELFGNISKITADCHDGGSATYKWRFQVSGVDDKTVGKLSGLLRHKIKFTAMRSAEADNTQERIPEVKTHEGDAPALDKPKDATDTFIDGGAGEPDEATKRAIEKAKRFPAQAAKDAAAAAKKKASKVVPFKVKAGLAARKAQTKGRGPK